MGVCYWRRCVGYKFRTKAFSFDRGENKPLAFNHRGCCIFQTDGWHLSDDSVERLYFAPSSTTYISGGGGSGTQLEFRKMSNGNPLAISCHMTSIADTGNEYLCCQDNPAYIHTKRHFGFNARANWKLHKQCKRSRWRRSARGTRY